MPRKYVSYRDLEILELFESGRPYTELAQQFSLTEIRIRQIISTAKTKIPKRCLRCRTLVTEANRDVLVVKRCKKCFRKYRYRKNVKYLVKRYKKDRAFRRYRSDMQKKLYQRKKEKINGIAEQISSQ